MKRFCWNLEKNEELKRERGISYEQVVLHIEQGDLLDVLEHPNQRDYAGQRVFVLQIEGYVYAVPFVEDDAQIFLKTIFPSRKLTRKYLRKGNRDGPTRP